MIYTNFDKRHTFSWPEMEGKTVTLHITGEGDETLVIMIDAEGKQYIMQPYPGHAGLLFKCKRCGKVERV